MATTSTSTILHYHNWRLAFLATVFAACAAVLIYRVYDAQVVNYDRYRALASDEHSLQKKIVPRRGDILDRNGNPLAVSVMYQSAFATPSRVTRPEDTADRLAPILGMPRDEILNRFKSEKSSVLLKQKLPAEVSLRIAGLGLPGIYLQQEPFRGYPEGSIAAQILGFTGKDSQGLAGLELSIDRELAGEPGILDAERDTIGGEIAIGRRELVPARQGSDAVLTIDRFIQRIAERELDAAVKENKGTGGFIIVMDPRTGGILAAASNPTYDLAAEEVFDPTKQHLYKPTLATDVYEPGSVMKVITMAAALEEKLVNPNTTFVDNGIAVIDGSTLRNWDLGSHGRETMTEVLINSCNIGAQWVAGQLGAERFYRYLDAFGFGKTTGVELPGEVPGMVRKPGDPLWGRVVLATNAYGQGIAVTALQMISAVATIANDGILPRPMLVKGFREGDSIRDVPPIQVRRVISPETASTLTDMMVHVVEDNSLKLAVVPGYKIAGKTGTADLPTQTGYNTSITYASQIGFAPVGDPRFIILVRIDGAEKKYGGQVASPVFKKVAEQILAYMKIPPAGPSKPRPTPTAVRLTPEPGPTANAPAPAPVVATPRAAAVTQAPAPAGARTAVPTGSPVPATPATPAGVAPTPQRQTTTTPQPWPTLPRPSATAARPAATQPAPVPSPPGATPAPAAQKTAPSPVPAKPSPTVTR